jgi:uncharacterized protein (DUF1697 family)
MILVYLEEFLSNSFFCAERRSKCHHLISKNRTQIIMTTYIALLRAVNVGGTGKLPMAELKAMCIELGFASVQTYIASGNVVFQSKLAEKKVKAALEARLEIYAGKKVGVLIRTAAEMTDVLANNPFPNTAPNRCVAIFLDEPPTANAMEGVTGRNGEEIVIGTRELYVHYGDGMADSKLKISAAKAGTARNMNTVAKLAGMARTA